MTFLANFRGKISIRRVSTYVNRVKHADKLKRIDALCTDARQDAKFIAFSAKNDPCVHLSAAFTRGRDLRRVKASDAGSCSLKLFTHEEVSEWIEPGALKDSVLLGSCSEIDSSLFAIRTNPQVRELADPEVRFLNWRLGMLLLNPCDAEAMCKSIALLSWHDHSKFCSRCGGVAERNVAGSHRDCAKCRARHFPVTNPAGIVLVRNGDDSKALLVRHTYKMRPVRRKYYTCVAGFCDLGESIESAVRREVAEEVGLEVEDVRYLHSQHWPNPQSSLMIGCFATAKGDQIPSIDPEELEDARWYDRDEIRECLRQADEAPLEGLGALDAQLNIPPKGTAAYELIRTWHDRGN